MFLPHIEQVTPLNLNKESNVLTPYPANVKKEISSFILNVLLDPECPSGLVNSTFGIKWAMECTGQSFSLPIESHQIISSGIRLYENWINGKILPVKFDQDRELFLKEMFGHFSLLFEPRQGMNKSLQKKHVNLCLEVINIFEELSTKELGFMEEDTWLYLLDIVLGICDRVLFGEGSKGETILTESLTPYLLKVLFDLWFQSKPKPLDHWKRFKRIFKGWRHRFQTIIQWSTATFALTNSVVNLLYGPNEGSDDVVLLLPPNEKNKFLPTTFQFDKETLIFYWKKILDLIENPNEITNPKNFLEAMYGIRNLVNIFLQVGNHTEFNVDPNCPYLPDAPDGNTILHIFGSWLFQAVQRNQEGFEQGTECAYGILFSIFTAPQTTPFLDIYKTNFYHSVFSALLQYDKYGQYTCAIFSNGRNIFLTELEGVYILLPVYMKVIKNILIEERFPSNISIQINALRETALAITSSLICLPNYLDNLEIKKNFREYNEIQNFELETFKDFKQSLLDIIVRSFLNEKDPRNATQILWMMSKYLHQHIEIYPQLIDKIIRTIEQFLCQPTQTQHSWPDFVYITAIHTLESFRNKLPSIFKNNFVIIPRLITKVSIQIRKLIENPPKSRSNDKNDSIICKLYNLILYYIGAVEWIFQSLPTLEEIFRSIEYALIQREEKSQKSKKKSQIIILEASEIVRNTSMNLFYYLIKKLNNFPLITGPSNISTLTNEKQLKGLFVNNGNESNTGEKEEQFNKRIWNFVYNKTRIITIMEESDEFSNQLNQVKEKYREKESISIEDQNKYRNLKNSKDCSIQNRDEKSLLLIIREITGRYAWRAKYRSFPLDRKVSKLKDIQEYKWFGETRPPLYEQPIPLTQSEIHEQNINLQFKSTNLDIFGGITNLQHKCIHNALYVQHRLQELYRYLKEETDNIDINCKRFQNDECELENENENENNININEYNFNNTRLFLSNFGLFQIHGKEKLTLLNNTQRLLRSLSILDRTSERVNQTISVVYLSKRQNRLSDPKLIYQNNSGSQDYNKFIQELGWFVNLEKHTGFNGLNQIDKNIKVLPYFSNEYYECIFHVSTMLNFEKDTTQKRIQYIKKNRIVIVWCDDIRPWNPLSIKSDKNKFFIIIRPHSTGMYHIQLFNYSNITLTNGPLLNNSFISRSILAELVRKTAILTDREISIKNKEYEDPLKNRNTIINSILEDNEIDLPIDNFFSKLFLISEND
ncbi:hypothetical protein M0812_01432 [Anaeramoeba flamelloides]|uniref:Rap-GAP domain-containing protein n=1 Tax=Anaeramoeba flamelloides TaxID=1746091 RepID=A0AAV8A9R5_9EUKA|nr:hypothetical protein M0812_01432 [Anaeramoeba flamelloides]